jgi:hypothetical protein
VAKRAVKTPKRAEAYQHDEQAVVRPEAGTRAQFKKPREHKSCIGTTIPSRLRSTGTVRTLCASSVGGWWRRSTKPPSSTRLPILLYADRVVTATEVAQWMGDQAMFRNNS